MPTVAWVAVIVVLGGVSGFLLARGAHVATRLLVATAFATSAIWAAAVLARSPEDRDLTDVLPSFGRMEGYGTSDACRACHPGQYGSWHDSFHRTMTQVADARSVVAPFDGRTLVERGHAFRVHERDGRYTVTRRDPETGALLEGSGELRVVMTTGSHHVQAYWLATADGTLVQFPFVYYLHEERWLANDDSFLQPPYDDDRAPDRYVWTDGCVNCHTTGGPWDPKELGLATASKTAVTELGIACEQCHGPAEAHAEANRSPARRYELHGSDGGDPTIVNPRRLDAERSSGICGHCHTVAEDRRGAPEAPFLPGERLGEWLDYPGMHETAARTAEVRDVTTLPDHQRDMVESFWTNGVTRVAGREYDAMIRSGCYAEGGMSCISCHTVHGRHADKQLPPEADDEVLCGGACHAELVADPTPHTHHAADSSGSECVNCHMPYASYGLLSGTRSHRLDSPVASGVAGRDAPNACNLCHLDRSLSFTADALAAWYGTETPELPAHLADVPAGTLWMLRGDAAQRALAAWHASWEPARRTADVESLRPALGILADDPYSAVRQIAGRALLRLDPSLPVDLDALTRDPQPALRRAARDTGPALDEELVTRLLDERDHTPVSVPE